METDPSVGRRFHHGDLHNALLDAAEALAKRGGPRAVTIRAATKAVGVTPAAAYRHFPGQEGLLAEMRQRALAMMAVALRPTTPAPSPAAADQRGAAKAALTAVARRYVRFALANPGLFRTAFSVGPPAGDSTAGTADTAGTGSTAGTAGTGSTAGTAGTGSTAGTAGTGSTAGTAGVRGRAHPFDEVLAAVDELADAVGLPAQRRRAAATAACSAVHGLAVLLVDRAVPAWHPDLCDDAVADVVAIVAGGISAGQRFSRTA